MAPAATGRAARVLALQGCGGHHSPGGAVGTRVAAALERGGGRVGGAAHRLLIQCCCPSSPLPNDPSPAPTKPLSTPALTAAMREAACALILACSDAFRPCAV